MKTQIGCTISLLSLTMFAGVRDASAVFEVTSDRAAFYSAHSNLAVEDFESATVAAGAKQSFGSPLSSASSNAAFAPGDIDEGITIRTLRRDGFSAFDPTPLVALGAGLGGQVSKSLTVETTGTTRDKMTIIFDQPQTAVGIDFSSIDLTTDLFHTTSILLDAYADPNDQNSRVGGAQFGVETAGGVFLGMTSEIPFSRIMFLSLSSFTAPAIDNLGYLQVPEAGTLCLAAIAGVFVLCRRWR